MAIDFHHIATVTDINKARELVVEALKADKCKVNVLSPASMNAQRGSQTKLRLIGGLLVDTKVLPVRLQVTFNESNNAGTVQVDAYDDLGFGIMLGFEEKYRQAVWDIMAVAVNAMLPVTVQAEAPSSAFCTGCGKELDASAKFCPACGVAR